MHVEVTYLEPKKYCPMCRRQRARTKFVEYGKELPTCKQCRLNFMFYTLTGEP